MSGLEGEFGGEVSELWTCEFHAWAEFLGGRLRKNSDQIVQIRHGTLILTMNRFCEYNYRW